MFYTRLCSTKEQVEIGMKSGTIFVGHVVLLEKDHDHLLLKAADGRYLTIRLTEIDYYTEAL